MAAFTTSEYGKFASIQNNSGSAAADAPSGGVYLFASGAAGSSKLYLNKEGSTDKYEVGTADLKIAADSGSDSTVSIGKGETLTIAGGTGLDTSVSGQTITFAVDLGELTEETLAVADDYIVFLDGGATGATKKEALADVVGNMAGNGLAASNGVLAVGVDDSTVELDSDAVRVKAAGLNVSHLNTAVAGSGLAGGGGSALSVNVDDSGIEINSDTLRLKDLGVATAKLANDAVTEAKLADNSVVNANVKSDAAIAANKLDFNVDLGGNVTFGNQADDTVTFTGHVNVSQALTASHARITNLDVVTLNSLVQTDTTLEISDKLIVAAVSASSANSDGGGLKIGGGHNVAGNASILYDHANSALDFNIGGTTEIRLADGVLRPETDNDVDLGASGAEFKDLYLDGVAYIDSLQADQLGAALDANSQAITNINVDSGAIDGATIGASSQSSGKFTTLSGSGAATFASTVTAQGNILPLADGAVDLGSSSKEFKDLYIDGVAYIDSLQADQLGAALDANSQAITNINVDSGAIDGAVIGANSAAAGTFTDLVAGGNVDLGDATSDTITATGRFDSDLVPSTDSARALGTSALQWSAAHVDVGHIDQLGSALDANSQAITNINVDSGAIDGTTIGANSAANGNFAQLTSSFGIRVNSLPAIIASNQINGAAGSAIQFDGSANVSIVNSLGVSSALTVGGGFGSTGLTVTDAGNLNMDGQLLVSNTSLFRGDVNFSGSGNTAPDVTFKQDGDQNGFLRWDSSENNLYLQYGSSGGNGVQVLTIGGNATSDYAIDVVNGSNNINKVRAAAFVTYSDESLKSDVASMSNTALDTVMSLEGVEFTWKDSGERDFGFIAQDVQSVLPKAVHVAEDGVQGVDYSRLTSVLVEAVKAQQVQIEDLKKTITNLKK